MPLVSIAVEDGLGVIRLERPKAINALNLEMIETMAGALEAWSHDLGIGAVLFTSNMRRGPHVSFPRIRYAGGPFPRPSPC